jgi:AP-2 complex subunit mu-1
MRFGLAPPDNQSPLILTSSSLFCSYRVTQNVNLPFTVVPVISEFGRSRVSYRITLNGNFDKRLFATNVIMRIPCPTNTAHHKVHVGAGKTKYEPATNQIVWRCVLF